MQSEMILNQRDVPLENGDEITFYLFTRNKWWNSNHNQQNSV